MTDQEMQELLDQTLAAQSKNARFHRPQPPDAHLSTPASQADLSLLAGHAARLGTRIPPSYAQFLRLTDGIDDYMQLQRLSLRPAKGIVDAQEEDAEWDDFEPLHEFVIASGDTSDFIAFDYTRADDAGEMPVVWIDGRGDRTEFDDFVAFLRAQLEFQQSLLMANEADRSGLRDD